MTSCCANQHDPHPGHVSTPVATKAVSVGSTWCHGLFSSQVRPPHARWTRWRLGPALGGLPPLCCPSGSPERGRNVARRARQPVVRGRWPRWRGHLSLASMTGTVSARRAPPGSRGRGRAPEPAGTLLRLHAVQPRPRPLTPPSRPRGGGKGQAAPHQRGMRGPHSWSPHAAAMCPSSDKLKSLSRKDARSSTNTCKRRKPPRLLERVLKEIKKDK